VCKTHARGEGVEKIDNFSVRFFFTFRIFFVSAEFGFILLLFCMYIFCALEYKAKSNTDVILNSNSDYFLKHYHLQENKLLKHNMKQALPGKLAKLITN